MSNAIPIRIADAVATELNEAVAAGSFSTGGWVAQRSYFDWDADFKDLDDVSVDVVFRTAQKDGEVQLDSIGFLSYTVPIDIVIRKRFEDSDRHETTRRLLATSVDAYVTLLQEILELFIATRKTIPLDDEAEANWSQVTPMSWVNQAKLRRGLFEGVVRVTFETRKAI